MTEMKRYGGYSLPEIRQAFTEMGFSGVPAAVFTDMVAGPHDKLVALHRQVYTGPGNRANNQAPLNLEFYRHGWGLEAFSDQPIPDSLNTVPGNRLITTIDLIEPNMGVGWHYDIVNGPGTNQTNPNAISVPIGFGLSMNLVGESDFFVENYDRTTNLAFPCGRLAIAQIIKEANLDDAVIDASGNEILHATLMPGDAIIWRQPYAHKVDVPSHHIKSKQRLAITVMQEAIFDASDIPAAA